MSSSDSLPEGKIRKRELLAALASAGFLSSSGMATANNDNRGGDHPGEGSGEDGRGRGEYSVVELGELDGIELSKYAMEIALHPNHDRGAFTAAVFGHGIQIYLADGINSPDAAPESIRQVTDGEDLVAGLEWSRNNRLQYDRGLTRYERKIPPSNTVYEATVIEEVSLEGVNSFGQFDA